MIVPLEMKKIMLSICLNKQFSFSAAVNFEDSFAQLCYTPAEPRKHFLPIVKGLSLH